MKIVVMDVSGCGKSTVGALLAGRGRIDDHLTATGLTAGS